MPSHQLVRRSNPEIAVDVLGQRGGGQQGQPVAAADASGMVTDDLTQPPARFREGPGHPNTSPVIFQNGGDSAGDALLEMVVLPAQKARGRSDPEGAV
jgi:hypothetical protein